MKRKRPPVIDPWSRLRQFLARGQACPFICPTCAETIIRPFLIGRLDEGSTPGVTIISAPAGFGYSAIG